MKRQISIPISSISTRLLITAWTLLLGAIPVVGQAADPLKRGFENPPESARPRVWWHWMNGNITQDGIKLDLEWMHRIGLLAIKTSMRLANSPGCSETPCDR